MIPITITLTPQGPTPPLAYAWVWLDADKDGQGAPNEYVKLTQANGFTGTIQVSSPTAGTRGVIAAHFDPGQQVTVTITGMAPFTVTMDGAGADIIAFTLP